MITLYGNCGNRNESSEPAYLSVFLIHETGTVKEVRKAFI